LTGGEQGACLCLGLCVRGRRGSGGGLGMDAGRQQQGSERGPAQPVCVAGLRRAALRPHEASLGKRAG